MTVTNSLFVLLRPFGVELFYMMSYMWYSVIAVLIAVVVAFLVSWCSGNIYSAFYFSEFKNINSRNHTCMQISIAFRPSDVCMVYMHPDLYISSEFSKCLSPFPKSVDDSTMYHKICTPVQV